MDYRFSTSSKVSVRPCGNLIVIRSDECKTPSVDLLDMKVYCYYLFTLVGKKKETEFRKCVNWDYKACEVKRTATNLVIPSPLTWLLPPSVPHLLSLACLFASSAAFFLTAPTPIASNPFLIYVSPTIS